MDLPRLDLAAIGRLSFDRPDEERFPCLSLAKAALQAGGAMPTVLNAANEIAVEAYMAGQIGFYDISEMVESVCSTFSGRRLSGTCRPLRTPWRSTRRHEIAARQPHAGPCLRQRSSDRARKGRRWNSFAMISGATGSLFLTLISFLVVLTVVVFIHEFGHFWVGRLCGVGVTAFSIGFGRGAGRLDRQARHPLEDLGDSPWRLRQVRGRPQCRQRARPGPARPDAAGAAGDQFPHQNVAKRAAIVAAGPIANFILAIAIFAGFNYFNGRQVLEPRIEAVQAGQRRREGRFPAQGPDPDDRRPADRDLCRHAAASSARAPASP